MSNAPPVLPNFELVRVLYLGDARAKAAAEGLALSIRDDAKMSCLGLAVAAAGMLSPPSCLNFQFHACTVNS